MVDWAVGFLELEEIDEADFGIFGGAVEDLGEIDRKAGKDQKKKKRKKRKRGDDDYALPGDGDLVVECEEEGEKGEKRVKKKRRSRKKRKVKEMEEKMESKEDVSDDNVEGANCFHLKAFRSILSGISRTEVSAFLLSGFVAVIVTKFVGSAMRVYLILLCAHRYARWQ